MRWIIIVIYLEMGGLFILSSEYLKLSGKVKRTIAKNRKIFYNDRS